MMYFLLVCIIPDRRSAAVFSEPRSFFVALRWRMFEGNMYCGDTVTLPSFAMEMPEEASTLAYL